MVIWKDSLLIRSRVFPLHHLSVGSSGLVSKYQIRFVFVSQSRRMDQCKHKDHLLKIYYRNMLKPHPGDSETFQEYRETVFLPYIMTQLRNVVCGPDIFPSALKILRGAREERIAVEASDRTPGSLEIGEPP